MSIKYDIPEQPETAIDQIKRQIERLTEAVDRHDTGRSEWIEFGIHANTIKDLAAAGREAAFLKRTKG